MEPLLGIVENGAIRIDGLLSWPDGTPVEIRQALVNGRPRAVDEDGDPIETPEEIERWLAEWRSIPPIEMTDEEFAAWEQQCREDKEWNLAHEEERHSRLMKIFET